MIIAVMNAIASRSLKKDRTSAGFEHVTSRYRCDASQLSYEATDVGSWSFVSSNDPVKNGSQVTYEMFHI